jgi:uncharacterized protein (TIGR03083 family)
LYVVEALTPAIGRDWSVRAGRLEWDVDHTLAHLTGAPAKYALYLASRSTRAIPVGIATWSDASQRERIDAVTGTASALAYVASSSPPDTRAFHSSGMLDPEGFCALACVELLVHGHDIASGLGLPFEPPVDVCDNVVDRVFPWLAGGSGSWETILWHTARIEVEGREPSDAMWPMVAIPLGEWDGTIPRRDPRPIVEWIRDDDAGRWRPRYYESPR